MKTIRAIVKGRVQGVWYRGATQSKASELQLSGYVKNLTNGDVEIVASGEEDSISELIKWAWHGPRLANVTEIDYQEIDTGDYDSFTIQY